MKIFLAFLASFILLASTSCNNYTVTGTCEEYCRPHDGKVSMRVLDNLDDRILQTTTVDPNGNFCFKGHIDEPCIIYVTSTDDDGYIKWHSMGILEEGNIVLNCKDYKANRTFLDCQGSGSPMNDLIQSYYRNESDIFNRVRESEKIEDGEFVQTLYFYPSVKKYLIEFVENNKTNIAGVFMAISFLHEDPSGITELPIEIQNNSIIRSFVEKKLSAD